ncbi:RING-type domain-containing protein [Mycena indigotica]|uniref:RING-type domain-containing protein n=1 Tax=Mycena indigotica TaxID=2126181 RepID=A0A8H6W374_9AGAR|nr:RING-type domain-containing protein [Mycena indigotica]KAF7303929.1 RING-type domain-containing protein [Mycena indigotica]
METAGSDSPQLRQTGILGSFLGRGRPRNTSQSHIDALRELSPSPPTQGPPSPIAPGQPRRRQPQPQPTQSPQPAALTLSHMLRRRRSAGNIVPPAQPPPIPPAPTPLAVPRTAPIQPTSVPPASSHRIRLVPHLDSRRSLRFDAISRDLKASDTALRIGRFTDRSGMGIAAVNAQNTNKIAFKSKVVSRAHAEVWVEEGTPPKFYIRDTKSSSGTFLNHVRLSPANTESRPHQIKDGDILQLGVDYQGGAEDIYKSVKIRIEVGREWQSAANAFNTAALKNLKTLAIAPNADGQGTSTGEKKKRKGLAASGIPDCCICLFPVTIRQALFLAPCSHAFHYKCLRPLLETHHPAFSCPLCRSFADLEEDVEIEVEDDDEEDLLDGLDPNLVATPHSDGPHAGPDGGSGDEGVLADDLDAEEGDEVDQLFQPPRSRFGNGGGGAETEVEDNGTSGLVPGAFSHTSGRRSAHFEQDVPVLSVDDEMMDVESGEGSGSGEMGMLNGGISAHARHLSLGDGTLGGPKRKR